MNGTQWNSIISFETFFSLRGTSKSARFRLEGEIGDVREWLETAEEKLGSAAPASRARGELEAQMQECQGLIAEAEKKSAGAYSFRIIGAEL